MSKHKKKRLGQVEVIGWGKLADDTEPDESFWGMPEQDTPVMEPEPPKCDSCHKLILDEPRYEHWSAPGVPLCVRCYNIVARHHRPPSKRS